MDGPVDAPLDESVAKDFDSLANKTAKLSIEEIPRDTMASYAKALGLIPQAIKTSILFLLRKRTQSLQITTRFMLILRL